MFEYLKDILTLEPNVLMLKSPIIVVGDIHGQFQDLLEIVQIGKDNWTENYLFLGF